MVSEFSSPPSSPARAASTSPSRFDLTPNSKVRALLASLDNDSDLDDEKDLGSARARLVSTFTKPTLKEPTSNSNNVPFQSSKHIPTGEATHESENEEEDEDVVRPKGRLAARMLEAESNAHLGSSQSRETSLGPTTKPSANERMSGSPVEDESNRDDGAVVSRKRKVRVPRPSTPHLNHRMASPALFVSPTAQRPASPADNASDSDELPANPVAYDRLKALVDKKRQESLVKENEAAAEKAKKLAARKQQNAMLDDDDDEEISDGNVERRLTQQAIPTRKASKRAQEEISRETQRMSRNMQLTHKAITKKKITKASLFARFNYKTADLTDEDTAEPLRPKSSSSAASHSDIEMRSTPPTSPASHPDDLEKYALAVRGSTEVEETNGEMDLPDLHEAFRPLVASVPTILNEVKGKAVQSLPEPPPMPVFKQRPIRIRPPKMASNKMEDLNDSESDLEVVSAKTPDAIFKKLDSIFDRVPAKQAKESNSLYALRMLAHIKSPGKQNVRRDKNPSMTTSELQLSLQQRARQQAAREREERLQALRDKGVIVQTAEEREKEMAEVEDLISKARREGEEIMKREKAAAKRERKGNGEVDPLGDSSDDEDWEEEKKNFDEQLSGSEEGDGFENDAEDDEEAEDAEEEDEMELDVADAVGASKSNPIFDDEAGETDDDEAEAQLSPDEEMGELEGNQVGDEEDELPAQQRRRNRKTNVISDDEDEQEQINETPSVTRTKSTNQLHTDSPPAPNSVLRSATKTFIPGLSVVGPAGLGLTQIFAGTMDESQLDPSPSAEQHDENRDDSMAFLRRRPIPELPDFVPTMSNATQDVVMDSQSGFNQFPESQNEDSQTQPIQLQFSQSQIHGFDSLVQDPMATQFSEMPEATQDAGFQHMTPIRGRFDAPPSTVDTVVLEPTRDPEPVEETPVVKKKGKLRRRAPRIATLSDEEDVAEFEEAEPEAEELDITANVFDLMRKASKKQAVVADEFDKEKSGAKEMVDDQADESEDEYAGLGGASDDESDGEEDAYVKGIIDDEGGKDLDEHKLAAFFA